MKKQIANYWLLSALSLIAFQTTGFSQIQNPDSATVTFKVNTAFVQDTLSARSTVSIRGTAFGGDGSLNNGIKLKNAGGDYWEAQKRVPVGPSGGTFKIATVTQTGTGWDRHVVNEFEITGDTTLTYFTTGLKETYTDPVTGTEISRGDDWNPLEIAKAGTTGKISVHFRVNMQPNSSFNRHNHQVQVRGNFNGWDGSTILYPEVRHDDFNQSSYWADEYFFSRTVLVPDSLSGKQIVYKFTYTDPSTQWESTNDRSFYLNGDTTLHWKTWCNLPLDFGDPISDPKIVLNYSVDMAIAINTNGFNKLTDTLYVKAGMGNTSPFVMVTRLAAPLAGNVFSGKSDSIIVLSHKPLFYSYFKRNADGEFEEFYLDHFDSTGVVAGPKYRKVLIGELNRTYQVSDKIKDAVSTHRQPFWKNYNKVGIAVLATFEVNLNPARFFSQEGRGTLNDFQDGPVVITGENIDSFAVYINGPATNTSNSWLPWNETDLGLTRQLNDEGINGDAIKGDHIWTIQYLYPANAVISQEFRFGIKGADNEGGTGFNHVYNLIDGGSNIYRVQFGEIHTSRYHTDRGYWDFVFSGWVYFFPPPHVENQFQPNQISLSAYPNPFNPATLISYSIPQSGKVSLKVFDLLGRQVAILEEEIKPAGTHQIPFRGDDLASGIYMVRVESGSKTESVKVILLK